MQADWNEFSVKEVEEKGDKTSPIHSYLASKTLAEQAAWKYVEEHKIPLVTLVSLARHPLYVRYVGTLQLITS